VTRQRSLIIIGLAFGEIMLAGCSGGAVTGNPTTPPASTTGTATSPAAASSDDAPAVQDPLPANVLDGNPCDTALTLADVTGFVGTPDPNKASQDPTGATCEWDNAAGNGASVTVVYQTKIDSGFRLAYKNVKPKAVRWTELQPVQGYPAVGYLADGSKGLETRECQVVVGISDNLSYSVGLILSDQGQAKGIDPCTAGRDVADRVLTNIKARG
jgi:Protein of unknown function (DUF3558)